MFLHAGWLHLLGNMLFLLIFGNNVEDRMGRLPFVGFYVCCGYVAAYGFAFGNRSSTEALIGASGAIAGVLGAYIVVFPRARVTSLVPFLFFFPLRLPAWVVLGGWFLLQWAYAGTAGSVSGGGRRVSGAHLRIRRPAQQSRCCSGGISLRVRTTDPWHRISHHGDDRAR